MRILSNSPAGKLIHNPANIREFLRQSNGGALAIVVVGKNLIASSEYTDHCSMMQAAGFEVRNYTMDGMKPEEATFRGAFDAQGVSIDVWHEGDIADLEVHRPAIKAAYDFLSSHRRLMNTGPLEIVVFDDDYVRSHVFDGTHFIDERVPPASAVVDAKLFI